MCDLTKEDLKALDVDDLHVLIDFMSRVRTISAKNCETVGDLITSAILLITNKFHPHTLCHKGQLP